MLLCLLLKKVDTIAMSKIGNTCLCMTNYCGWIRANSVSTSENIVILNIFVIISTRHM